MRTKPNRSKQRENKNHQKSHIAQGKKQKHSNDQFSGEEIGF